MTDLIQGTLYIDPQDQIPAGSCPRCGGVVYDPSRICIRCERDGL